MHRFLALLLPLALALPAAAAEKQKDGPHARAVAPFLDDRTVVVVHVDLRQPNGEAFLKQLARLVPESLGKEELRNATEWVKKITDAGAHDIYLIVSLADVPQAPPFVVVPLGNNADIATIKMLLGKFIQGPSPSFETIGGALVAGAPTTLTRLKENQPAPRPEITQAFAAVGPGMAHILLVLTTDSRKIIEENLPTLPPPLGGVSSKVLTRGLNWVGLRLDAPPKITLHATIQAADNEAAKALKELLLKVYDVAGKEKNVRQTLPEFDKLVRLLTPEVAGDKLTLNVDAPTLAALLKQPVAKIRGAAQRAQTMNNLKQLALAMHNYHDTHKSFPAYASFDKQGKPLLSWRVHLLPYLNQDKLYKEFHLDEPWDSEHNKTLIARMPAVFASPGNPRLAAAGKTTCVVPRGPDTLFPDKKGFKIFEITDGTSNTIMILDVEDDHAVIWTKPEDLDFDPKEPFKGLGGKYGDGFLAAIADGSVRFLSAKLKKETLKALITPRGGEAVEELYDGNHRQK